MLGSIVKYGLVAIAGGLCMSFSMEYSDSCILENTEAMIAAQKGRYMSEGNHTAEEISTLMAEYVAANRKTWEAGILMAGNLRRMQDLYAQFI